MSATTRYRHTQIGWVIIGSLGTSVLILGLILAGTRLWGPLGFALALLLASLALFATLTVEIDDQHLRLRFGVGLVRKRIALSAIRYFSVVRNPWVYGWGIHLTPAGVLYNVSGFSAVQLQLKDGKSLRIGTDEPEALCQALEQVIGPPQPLSAAEALQAKRASKRMWLIVGLVLGAVAVFIGALFYFHEQPPNVTLTGETFKVTSALYSQELAFGDITQISLVERLPRIRLRTNGYALGGTLRGHFRLDELGDGQLYVEYGHPPYVLIRRGEAFVSVNFADPAETTDLFRRLDARWRAARAQ